MPTVYSQLSESAREVKRINTRARRAAWQDLQRMYPAQFAVLFEGYKREMKRETFGDPDYTTTLPQPSHNVRASDGRFIPAGEAS